MRIVKISPLRFFNAAGVLWYFVFQFDTIVLFYTKNLKQKDISLNQYRGMSAEIVANGMRNHTRTHQKHVLELRSWQSLDGFRPLMSNRPSQFCVE